MGRVSRDTWRWQHHDETAPVWPGHHQQLGATWTPEATNFAVWSPEATAAWVCLFDEDGAETRHQLTEHTLGVWHGAAPRRPGRPALRLPRRRALGPRPRPPVQPGQAAARPVRPGDHRRGRRPARSRWPTTPPTRSSATTVDSAPAMPRSVVVHDEFDWEGDTQLRTRWRDTVIYELHVKGFTQLHNEIPERAARHVRRPRQPHRHPLPQRPRGHRGRAAAGPPLPHRAVRGRPGHGQLLGLQLDRLLRPARGVLLRGRRAASRSPSSSRW